MSPLRLGSAYVEIDGDDKKLDAAFNRARGKTTAFGSVITGILQGVGQRLFDGIVSGASSLINKMGEAVVASSNLNEAINKTSVVFGSSADEMLAWSETSATALGQSKRQALDAAAGFGALFIQMGNTRPAAAEMSQGLVQLASDLSSIYNIPMDQALEKIRAGLAGETEPLRQVNIFLNDNLVKNKAMAMGLAESTDAVSDAAKVQARYALILEQGAIANGDFANTSREFANGQKILAAQIEDGAARMGNAFRPAAAAIQNTLIDLAPQMFSYAQNITDQFANGLAAGIRAIIPVIQTIRQLFTYWFQPGSPPKILPDIDKWGKGTMQAWLDGMATVDVKKAFDTVGRAVEGVMRSFVGAGKMDEGALVGSIFGSRDAIAKAVEEFRRLGSVSESTIRKIASSAGPAGGAISTLVKTYFDLQKASEGVRRAQDALNRTTEEYDAIINPLRGALDDVRGQQQALANQQRLIAAQNTLNNFESTAAEKQAAQLEIQQIALENQLAAAEAKKAAAVDGAQASVDAATKEEAAAQLALDAAQATIDRQVETNNLLAEQKRLVEQLAAAQEAAAAKAQAAAEKAANEAEQLAAKAQREAEQLAAAQLRYNLEIADTPGKIALMEAELAKLTPGTADYFDTLTRIAQLQEQYKNELEQTAKAAGALGGLDIGPGLDTGIKGPLDELMEQGEGAKNLKAAWEEAFAPLSGPIPEAVKKLADALDKLGESTAFQKISDALYDMGVKLGLIKEEEPQTFFTSWADAAEGGASRIYGANAKIDEGSDLNVSKLTANIGIITELMNGNWSEAWRLYKEYAITAYGEVDTETTTKLDNMEKAWGLFSSLRIDAWAELFRILSEKTGTWFTDQSTAWGTWFTDQSTALGTWFSDTAEDWGIAGGDMVDKFLEGIQGAWSGLTDWLSTKLESLTNLIPPWLGGQLGITNTAPAQTSRSLPSSNESMLNQLQAGVSRMLTPAATQALLPAGATTNNNNTTSNMSFSITINGAANADDARKGAQEGVLSALRAAGVR